MDVRIRNFAFCFLIAKRSNVTPMIVKKSAIIDSDVARLATICHGETARRKAENKATNLFFEMRRDKK